MAYRQNALALPALLCCVSYCFAISRQLGALLPCAARICSLPLALMVLCFGALMVLCFGSEGVMLWL
jgi:hypothetical protein